MSYYTKITKAGLAAITAAMNNNSKVPITYMAFGDGNGYIPEPDENATSLVNEVYRVGVNKVEVHNKNPNWLVCEAIIPSAVGGFNIREVALYDNTGTKMLAVASYPPTYKPTVEEGAAKIQTIRIVLQVDNTGNFELVIDPDVVLATTQYVEDQLIASKIKTSFGRDLESKNKDVVSALDFGIIPNIEEDQTNKFDVFVNYIRENKVKGIVPAGKFKLTANKNKIFGTIGENNYRSVMYAIDVSGIDIEGIYKGYENQDGTILDIQNTGIAFLQADASVKNTTYSIKNFRAENCSISLNMTYALMCRVENFVYKNCENGVVLGEPTMTAGAMCNVFINVYGKSTKEPLKLLGNQWNNANQFHNCFFTGGLPSFIHVPGGYGALANTFYGGEFNTPSDVNEAGLIIGNSRNTSFYNTYFEPRGHAVILDGQAKKVLLSNCTYGSTRNNATKSPQPSIIWHKSGASSVMINGGSVFLGDNTGLQDNLRLIYSSDPAKLICDIHDTPYAYLTGTVGWKIADIANVSQFNSFNGVLTDSTPVQFSANGGNITGLLSGSKVSYSINGKEVTAVIDLFFDENTVFNSGNYYIHLLFNPKNRTNGVTIYSKPGNIIAGNCSMSEGNKNLFLWMPKINATFDENTKTVSASLNYSYMSSQNLNGYNVSDSRVTAKVSYLI